MPKRSRDSDEDMTEDCSICHESIEIKGCAILKLECQHNFHLSCIQKWLCVNSSCPNCRCDNNNVARFFKSAVPTPTTSYTEPIQTTVLHIPPEARRFAEMQGAIYDWDRRSWVWSSRQPLPRTLTQYLTPLSRVYVRVPFAEKDEAKELGARWDPVKICWYFLNSVPETARERWRVVNV